MKVKRKAFDKVSKAIVMEVSFAQIMHMFRHKEYERVVTDKIKVKKRQHGCDGVCQSQAEGENART